MLAVNEGSFTNAIGRIQQEKKGFINFSKGTIDEFEKQKEIATGEKTNRKRCFAMLPSLQLSSNSSSCVWLSV